MTIAAPATMRHMTDTREALVQFMEDFSLEDAHVASIADCTSMTVYRWRSGRVGAPKRSVVEAVMRHYGADPADYGLKTPESHAPPWFTAWADQHAKALASVMQTQEAILKKLYAG